MGCALSASDEAEKKRSDAIDKSLAADRLSRKDEIKLLLLGEWCGPAQGRRVNTCPVALVWNVSLAAKLVSGMWSCWAKRLASWS